jgi:hypothetical protein
MDKQMFKEFNLVYHNYIDLLWHNLTYFSLI